MAKKSRTALTKSEQEEMDKRIMIKVTRNPIRGVDAKKKILRDYYGKLKDTFGDALEYKKKVRDEW